MPGPKRAFYPEARGREGSAGGLGTFAFFPFRQASFLTPCFLLEGTCLARLGEKLWRTRTACERVMFAHGSHSAASAYEGPSCSGKSRPQEASAPTNLVQAAIFSYLDLSPCLRLCPPPIQSPYRSRSDVLISFPPGRP